MRYRDAPQGFRVAHSRHLYDACLSSAVGFRNLLDGAVFVLFDAEPWSGDNAMAAEIGISMLQTRHRESITCPATLAEVVHHYAIQTHRRQIIDTERQRTGEAHRFGQEHRVSSADVEQYILGLVDSYKQRVSPTGEQTILVGFDLQVEFRLLSTVYIGLTNYFTSWVDVQELARLASSVDKPGLSQTLKACGVGQEEPADLHSLTGRHNAATDTVRTAAILHQFLTIKDCQLEIATSERNASMLARRRRAPPSNFPEERKIWSGTRPKPKELYPYIARVKHSSGDILSATDLLETFAAYEPVAVGTAKQRRYGWVCLSSLGSLDEFLGRVNGSQNSLGDTWIAISDYDPEIVPAADMRELKERLHARADEKREQRRLKRLASEESLHTKPDTEVS